MLIVIISLKRILCDYFFRSLYKARSNVEVVEALLHQYIDNLSTNGCFSGEEGEVRQPACALLWTYYYASQHYDFLGDTTKALEYINTAIEHTPTLIELFIVKGRIYKVLIYILKAHLSNLEFNSL